MRAELLNPGPGTCNARTHPLTGLSGAVNGRSLQALNAKEKIEEELLNGTSHSLQPFCQGSGFVGDSGFWRTRIEGLRLVARECFFPDTRSSFKGGARNMWLLGLLFPEHTVMGSELLILQAQHRQIQKFSLAFRVLNLQSYSGHAVAWQASNFQLEDDPIVP